MTNAAPSSSLPGLAERYALVQEQIAVACQQAGRDRSSVSLIVVSKFHPAELVLELISLGQRDFGENKDQEAGPKAAAVAEVLAAAGSGAANLPSWHFVGQLQSNKVKSVLRYADSIHSLDRESLLQALAKERAKLALAAATDGFPEPAPTKVFIELNLTQDPERGGISQQQLLPFAEQVLATPGLELSGVMGVASLEGQEERDFATIQRASEQLQTLAPAANLISAGMSNDFEIALQYGATHLRIGTAITGPRQYLT